MDSSINPVEKLSGKNLIRTDKLLISLFLFVSILFPVESLYLFYNDASFPSVLLVYSYLVMLIVVQVSLLFAAARYARIIFLPLYSLLTIANYLFLYWVSFGFISALSENIVFLTAAIAAIVLWRMLSRYGQLINKNNFYTLSALFIAVFVLHIPFVESKQNIRSVAGTKTDLDEVSLDWSAVKLKEKPNIYLIGFDALIPLVSAKRFMGLNQLAYTDVLNKIAYTSERAYAPRVATSNSLNSLMNFDQNTNLPPADRFMGNSPSLLSSAFHNNGYRVSTGWTYLKNKGNGHFVDNFIAPDISFLGDTTLCVEERSNWSQYKFFALCRHGKYLPIGYETVAGQFISFLQAIVKKLNIVDDEKVLTRNTSDAWVGQIITAINSFAKMEQPQVAVFYIFDPMTHTNSQTYRHTDLKKREAYKNKFIRNSEKLASIFSRLHSMIMKVDPDALVMVFGDHGAYFTRGINPEDEPEKVFFDRHVIEVGLLKTKNRCASSNAFAYSSDYATSARMLTGLIRCLAVNPVYLDGILDFVDSSTPVADLEAIRKAGGAW